MPGVRPWIVLATFLFVALAVGCSGGTPHIELPTTSYDFGPIPQGEVATVQLPVRNTGQGDLHIEAVSTSCGCTSAYVEPQVIPAGGEGTLTVRYDSSVHPDSGPVRRIVYIASDDPQAPEVEVEITAQVQAP
ncbi:MAG: DUF1573 domain-containing protein [Anaerolineae bacterium]